MIVYQATKSEFLHDTHSDEIEKVVNQAFQRQMGRGVGVAEVRSWKESLSCMARVLMDDEIPLDTGVAIEYNIPQTSKRVDVLLTGKNELGEPRIIVVELKQWQTAELTAKDGVVSTFVGGARREVSHPSYQAWSYAALLTDFNEAVYSSGIELKPCAYLHNYEPDGVIAHEHYAAYVERAPLFLTGAAERRKLAAFIRQHVKYGDDLNLMYRIENGRIKPSKSLADSLAAMLAGKPEFVLIDDQKVVYETALSASRTATPIAKKVVIVDGGPGTGKSVVAMNLLSALLKLEQNCRYVSRNAAPRAVYEARLTGHFRATRIRNLMSGSGAFVDSRNEFDTLIVDEAHRLNEKSGLYGNLGVDQVKELIDAASCTVFFLDEDQRVTWKDVGSHERIKRFGTNAGAEIIELKLESQFRCNGSDGYLAWLDDALNVHSVEQRLLDPGTFDFRVIDSANELHALIEAKNSVRNKARVVAGYCWDWVSRKDPTAFDIVIPQGNYQKRWNLSSDSSLWIIAADSVSEVGCIHTCQGLEVDYIGVIVGDDLLVRDGTVIYRAEGRSGDDHSIRGWKAAMKVNPVETKARVDAIIKNTYRTLMTRGMKGCYIHCTDPETAQYFKSLIRDVGHRAGRANVSANDSRASASNVYPFKVLQRAEVQPFKDAVPLYDLKIAAGSFGDFQLTDIDSENWVALPDHFKPAPGLFVAQVVGESMNRRISNGAWCLFRTNPGGTRVGKVVIAQHRSIEDPDLGGSLTIKVYRSTKVANADSEWEHAVIRLEPDSDDRSFKPLVFTAESAERLKIVAELVDVL